MYQSYFAVLPTGAASLTATSLCSWLQPAANSGITNRQKMRVRAGTLGIIGVTSFSGTFGGA
jgi:hypothetical protein